MYLADLFEVSQAIPNVPEGDEYVTILPKGLLPWVELNVVVERQAFEGIYLQSKQHSPDAEPVLDALMTRGNRDFREKFAECESVKRTYTELISKAMTDMYSGRVPQSVGVGASTMVSDDISSANGENSGQYPSPTTESSINDASTDGVDESVNESPSTSMSESAVECSAASTGGPTSLETGFVGSSAPESDQPVTQSIKAGTGFDDLPAPESEQSSSVGTGFDDLPAPDMEESTTQVDPSNPLEEAASQVEESPATDDSSTSVLVENTDTRIDEDDKYNNPLTGPQTTGFPDLNVVDTGADRSEEDGRYDDILGARGGALAHNVVMDVVETDSQQVSEENSDIYSDATAQGDSELHMNIEPSVPGANTTSDGFAVSVEPMHPFNEGAGEELLSAESTTQEISKESFPVEPATQEISDEPTDVATGMPLGEGIDEKSVEEDQNHSDPVSQITSEQIRQQEFVTLIHAVEAGNAGVAVCPDWAHECLNSFVGMYNDFLDYFQSVSITQIFDSANVTAADFYEELCEAAYRGSAIQENTEVPETNEQFVQLFRVAEVEALWWCYLQNMDNAVHIAKLFADLIYEG